MLVSREMLSCAAPLRLALRRADTLFSATLCNSPAGLMSSDGGDPSSRVCVRSQPATHREYIAQLTS